MITKIQNPILSGFHPDPSICRVGEAFYLVNSTFAYFPGVPIYRSKDLKHWEQIGNVLNRKSQLELGEVYHSGGIYAPTIRYHEGLFYMVTTNIGGGGNFYVTAEKPEGPWSDPVFLGEAAQGIDPTLFFDEDGKCYYVGTRDDSENCRYWGDGEIYAQELDLGRGKLIGESHRLWKGAMKDAEWPEGPHFYRRGAYYYLMIAEGGTGLNHSITIARSKNIYGPYEGFKNNPILSHRHLGSTYPVINVGHGDLFTDPAGNWYMVMLASRPCEGFSNLGRETFLAKVEWQEDWPVVNPGIGHLEEVVEVPLAEVHTPAENNSYHFYRKTLGPEFLYLRNPREERYSLTEREGFLRLYGDPDKLEDCKRPTYAGIRQLYQNYQIETRMELCGTKEQERGGLAVIQSNEFQIRLECFYRGQEQHLCVTRVEKKPVKNEGNHSDSSQIEQALEITETCLAEQKIAAGAVELRIMNHGQSGDFYYKENTDHGVWILLCKDVDMSFLSTEAAGGFVGCTYGMFASTNGEESQSYADFSWFSQIEA